MKAKLKLFLLLIDLTDNGVFRIIWTMDLLMYIFYAYIYAYAYILWIYKCLCIPIYTWNKWDQREELGLLCYYKVLTLSVKWFTVIWKRIWISYKSILQTPGQLLNKLKKNRSETNILKEERKWHHRWSVKTTNHRKRVEDKNTYKKKRVKNNNQNMYIERHVDTCLILILF